MPAPTTPVLDIFNGVAGTPLPTYDPIWAQFAGAGITLNAGIATPNGACAAIGGHNGTDYRTPVLGADNECYATISKMPTADGLALVLFVRIQNPTNTATVNACDLRWTYSAAGADTFTLNETVAGVLTQLASDASGSFDPALNNQLLLSVIGGVVSASLFDGTLWRTILTAPTTVAGTGSIGFYIRPTSGEFTAFGGGTVAPLMTPPHLPVLAGP